MTWGDAGTSITALGGCAAATLAFRLGDELRVAVVVKATFVIAPDGPMVPVDPDPILRADQLRDNGPVSSLLAAGDLVPYRPRADVLLHGHARAPGGRPTPAMAVRLMVARGSDVVIDKRLAVRGTLDPQGKTREPAPFAAMRFAWELSARTPDNPVGIRETPHAWPHVVDPRQRDRAAGFGPLSPRWPSRRRLLKLDESAFAAPIPALPREFAFAYFNAAPEDQRVDFFRGDEWVGFEGMNSQLPRVQSYLPGVVGRARVYGPQGPSLTGHPVPLEADTLVIDTDRLRCSVVWRGSFPMAHEKYLGVLYVVAGVESAEQQLAFPAAYTRQPSAVAASPPAAPRADAAPASGTEDSRTAEIPVRSTTAGTPFAPSSAAPRPARERPLPAATPFEGAKLVPAPPPVDAAGTTDVGKLARRPPPSGPGRGPAPTRSPKVAPRPEDETLRDDDLLPELAGTLPNAPQGAASALPFTRSAPRDDGAPPGRSRALPQTPASAAAAPAPPAKKVERAWSPDETALDAAGTVDVKALLAGKVLPFADAPAPPAATPPAPPRKAFNAGATMAVPAFFSGDALPFGVAPSPVAPSPVAPPGAAPPRKAFDAGATMGLPTFFEGDALPFAAAAASAGSTPAAPVSAPPSAPSDGATMMIDSALLGASLPFAEVAPAPVFSAPAVAPAYAPVAPVAPAPTFAPVPSTFAPVAPARVVEPEVDAPTGEAPQTLGAFFLAAMARAGARDQPLRSGASQ